jgi:hypothetical protein
MQVQHLLPRASPLPSILDTDINEKLKLRHSPISLNFVGYDPW